jgi:hypothetical protein
MSCNDYLVMAVRTFRSAVSIKKILTAICSFCTILLTTGCASVTNSKLQPLSVVTYYKGDEVEGAKCTLTNDKGSWYVTAPGSVTVQKSYGDMVVTCKKKGIPTGISTVVSGSNGGVWGNILAGGVIGYAVDASSGAGFDYPTGINVEMGKTVSITPPKTASSTKRSDYQQ